MKYKHWYNPKTHEVKKSETQPEGYFKITPYAYGQILNDKKSLFAWKNEAENERRWADLYFRKWQEAVEQSVHRTALPVRVLNAICYGITLATFLWLLFGSR